MMKKARPKVTAILRTRHIYNDVDLINQYKTHVLPLLGFSSGAIFHAAKTHLWELKNIQKHFLNQIGMTHKTAFLDHNLAPRNLRRDIAVLGLLHKNTIGEAHPAFNVLFPHGDGGTNQRKPPSNQEISSPIPEQI